ncbi:bromodomain-containing chromatin remodeling transcription factor [Hamiltosporidium tvaerminnensis]|uniref:Bromodomain-containing chromatin remodeling transcription factor n=2 Tax=Hamiltosporidium TaxID=1176354 RepID=A0A4Q9L2Z4_9MICR|nr:transcription initiation at TATA-containing promoter protein [Hamiltosporidium tvaerminnensis]TBU01853.1 bromodomain-containing chromatin remodeling transcription factor [Hamiltosporidium tvaerminnensis]TBU09773.1 bromodomain-containing chromatin remodeling transcription factor [Hamiltosporidium magnivora]TBU20141.1 bromodomain-containing chromatin remodeling transcription factor [Hamiltosporidium tvaerminnensis]
MMVNEDFSLSPHQDSQQDILESQLKYCKEIITRLKRYNAALPFLEPVDPVKLNIPDYPLKVKHPMDLSTIKNKLDAHEYSTPSEFKSDFDLMISNCFIYNPKDTYYYKMGVELEKAFNNFYVKLPTQSKKTKRKEDSSLSSKAKKIVKTSLKKEDYDFCDSILNEILKSKNKKFNWPFLKPVDIKLVPDYSKFIENPTDLSTIRNKLDSNYYGSVEEFRTELQLMIDNCHTFNLPDSDIYLCGTELQNLLNSLFERTEPTVFKEKDIFIKISELKKKKAAIEREIEVLESKLSGKKEIKTYSFAERIDLGNTLMRLNEDKMTQVAMLIKKSMPEFDILNKDEVEIDMRVLPDNVVGEIDGYLRDVTDDGIISDSSSE